MKYKLWQISRNNFSGYSKLKFALYLSKIGPLYMRLHLKTVSNICLLLQWKLWCVQCPCKGMINRKKNKMICLHYVPPDKVIATIVSTFALMHKDAFYRTLCLSQNKTLWDPIETDMFTSNNLTRNIASMPLNNFLSIRFLL